MAATIYLQRLSRRNGRNRLLAACLLLIIGACKPAPEKIRILFVGDVLLSRNVSQEIHTRGTFPWDSLRPLFSSADVLIGNLEGAVGEAPKNVPDEAMPPLFAIDSTDIGLLKQAGFTAMTVENNHSLDLGIAGKQASITSLLSNGIKAISNSNSPYFFQVKGQVIALVSINTVPSRDSSRCELPSITVRQKLHLAKSLANLVIVSIHWGSELLEWPNKQQYETAKWLIAEGADVIIGHHPHVVQKPELIDGKPVYFSLGNHLFDQKYPATKQGLIAELDIENGKLDCKGIETKTSGNSFYPSPQGREQLFFSGLSVKQTHFEVNGFQLIPQSIEGTNKTMLSAYKDNRLMWKSYPLPLVSVQRTKIDGQNECLFALENYYSSIDNEVNLRPYVYALDETGLIARWRGSALAWPILDAQMSSDADQVLLALHRGDSFVSVGTMISPEKIEAYRWNGFGFKLINDTTYRKAGIRLFN